MRKIFFFKENTALIWYKFGEKRFWISEVLKNKITSVKNRVLKTAKPSKKAGGCERRSPDFFNGRA